MSSFTGFVVKPGKDQPYVPPPEEVKFHLSQATVEGNLKQGESVTVWAKSADVELIVCRLTAGANESMNLDYIFDHYTEFSTKGAKVNVHLAGYYIPVEDEGYPPGMLGEDDEDEDDEDDEDGMMIPIGRPPFGEDSDDEDEEEGDSDDEFDSDDEDEDDEDMPGGVKIEEIDDDGNPVDGKKKGVIIEEINEEEEDEGKEKKPEPKKTPAKATPAKKAEEPASGQKRKAETTPAEKSAKKAAGGDAAPTPASADKGKLSSKEYDNGFKVEDLELGKADGKVAKQGQVVTVRYKGWLKSNNKVFDETKGNATFSFRLGVGEVIKGWDRGVVGMRVGDKRRLTVPPQMGYGSAGAKPVIPPNAWLMFDVTLVGVKG